MLDAPIEPQLSRWGETVGYYRLDSDGTPHLIREITAVIGRSPVAALVGVDGAGAPELTALLRNHTTTGVDLADLNTAKDSLLFAERIGATAAQHAIHRVIDQDATALYLELR